MLVKSAAVADAVGTAMLVLDEVARPKVIENLRNMTGCGDLGVLLLFADGEAGLREVGIGWPEENR